MAECPFCKGAIDAELAQEGGRCPHCLIEIPGEDAPTDPGEDAKARQAAEEAAAAASKRRSTVFAMAAVALLGLAGIGGVVGMQLTQEPAEVADGWDDFEMIDLGQHKDADLPEGEQDEAQASSQRSGRTGRRTNNSGGSGSALANNGTTGSAPSTAGGSGEDAQASSILGTSVKTTTGSKIGLDLGSGPSVSVVGKGPEGIVLSDPGDIRKMVQTVLKTGGAQLKACYESELKADESIRGSWEISFSLDQSGKANEILISPNGKSHKGLESCMARKVESWRFQKIAQPTRIVKNFSFDTGW